MKKIVFCFALMFAATLDLKAQTTISLKATDEGRVFEGIGAVSAGASTRNTVDYPEKQRSEILDYLFKPKFGAGFQHLKVEIGGGENSTAGSEPSHAITREELTNPKPRGYEFWLMSEARKRNPNIILNGLPWAYPNWVGDRFSQASADWFVSFLEVARKDYHMEVDWVSASQNEMGTDLNWVAKTLRPTLDAHGFSKVKLIGPDDNGDWQIFDELEKNPDYKNVFSAIGYHYVDGHGPWNIDQKRKDSHNTTEKAKQSGKPLWATEEWSNSGKEWGGPGGLYLARLMNKLYALDRITKYEIWAPIDGMYDAMAEYSTGAMQADQPWSGHYTVWPSIWAVAHTTQFAEPGWVYMDSACGQLDTATWRGSHVALQNPKTGDWSVIIVTGDKKKVRLNIGEGLKKGPVYLWKSTAKEQFIQQKPLRLTKSSVEVELEGDAIYTLTSTTGQRKGSHGTPPEAKPFPFPYKENFESYSAGETPRYISDQKGTFETCQSPKGGICLAQIVPKQGIMWFGQYNWALKPFSIFGDINWKDYAIEGDVLIDGGDVEIGGRYGGMQYTKGMLGYRWILTSDGRWQLNWQHTTLTSGQIELFDPGAWHHLRLEMKGNQIVGLIDGKKLTTVSDTSHSIGMAFIASTYNRNLFDNIKVDPITSH
ncbi:hypothetical protein [Pedobacter sp. L105]|uniref:hypothetical protein n=1 Tax=Pedobacter sp. L105 TaxID=1641871 RepID=UPI00131CC7BF|nr:hypothetical protein [Pedobacter sp. L105]